MIAYYYISKNETEEALECGLKLSVYGEPIPGSGEIPINAIRAYLSPRDNMDYFQNQELICLKLDLPAEKLLVAEKSFTDAGKNKWFNESIVHAAKYMLGTYRNPCYLITFTVLNEYISVLDKNRDVPVLYDNSSELYLQSVRSKLREADEGYPERALFGYLGVLVSLEEASVEWSDKKTTVFNLDGERYILKKPADEI